MQEKTQRQVLKEGFEEKEITNHVQATFYNKLGDKVTNGNNTHLKEVFPHKSSANESEEWKIAYGLVNHYLKVNKMELTRDSARQFIDSKPLSSTECAKRILYQPSDNTIKELVRDQKMFLILDPKTLDYDLPQNYYATN